MAQQPKEIEQAIAVVLEADASGAAPAIEEKTLVRRVLEFANTGRPEGLPGARVLTQQGQTFLLMTPEQDAQHVELQRDLAAIVKGELSGPATARLLKQARYVMVRRYELVRGTLRRIEKQFAEDLRPVLADVLLHIRSSESLQRDVRQCRLPGCGRFFLVSDQVKDPSAAGRRPHRYCSPEHMSAAQTPGAERTRLWRQRRAQGAPKHK